MESITIRQLQRASAAQLRELSAAGGCVITSDGEPVARLEPLADVANHDDNQAIPPAADAQTDSQAKPTIAEFLAAHQTRPFSKQQQLGRR